MLDIDATHAATGPAAPVSSAPRPGRVATLAIGDLVAFLLFAAQGRHNHGEAVGLGAVAVTAAPFLIAWFATAPWFGAFGRRGSAATTRPGPLLSRTVLSWVVAWLVALALRRLVFGGDIPPAFAIVALLVNAVLLLGWRGVAAALFWRR